MANRECPETVAFRVKETEKHLFKFAAASEGESLSGWLRRAAETALERDLGRRAELNARVDQGEPVGAS